MKLKIYQVDAFAGKLFKGNPAAVIPLKEWLSTELMQQIAMENNLSETVFYVPVAGLPEINSSPDPLVIDNIVSETSNEYEIRWFTPEVEINLCGHATLAAAFILFDVLKEQKESIVFKSMSGLLFVEKAGSSIQMNFPSWKPGPVEHIPEDLSAALGEIPIVSVHKNRDLLVELENEEAVLNCQPDFGLMKKHFDKLIITAKGEEVDFVSRFFAPGAGINEDPVTGSAHSQLIPFWSEKLGRKKMMARQLSARVGDLICEDIGDRVLMGGSAVLYLTGEIHL
jgi:PhzF family phenazine biosynthesis protein